MNTVCTHASNGCNGPKEGECMGLCAHRINTDCMTKPVVSIKGKVEELPVQMHDFTLKERFFQFFARSQKCE